MKEKIFISVEKLQELTLKREEIEEQLLPRIREEKRHAIDTGGGTHDNASYEALLLEEDVAMKQITELNRTLGNSVIINYTDIRCDEVRVGTRVLLTDLDKKAELQYEIVGAFDTNIKENKIAYDTPIGKQLLGLKVNEVRIVKLPNGTTRRFLLTRIDKSER